MRCDPNQIGRPWRQGKLPDIVERHPFGSLGVPTSLEAPACRMPIKHCKPVGDTAVAFTGYELDGVHHALDLDFDAGLLLEFSAHRVSGALVGLGLPPWQAPQSGIGRESAPHEQHAMVLEDDDARAA